MQSEQRLDVRLLLPRHRILKQELQTLCKREHFLILIFLCATPDFMNVTANFLQAIIKGMAVNGGANKYEKITEFPAV